MNKTLINYGPEPIIPTEGSSAADRRRYGGGTGEGQGFRL